MGNKPPAQPASDETLAIRFVGDAKTYAEAAVALSYFKHLSPRYYLFCH
jgi:hypothetical protein